MAAQAAASVVIWSGVMTRSGSTMWGSWPASGSTAVHGSQSMSRRATALVNAPRSTARARAMLDGASWRWVPSAARLRNAPVGQHRPTSRPNATTSPARNLEAVSGGADVAALLPTTGAASPVSGRGVGLILMSADGTQRRLAVNAPAVVVRA
jgi:hypothetical protein